MTGKGRVVMEVLLEDGRKKGFEEKIRAGEAVVSSFDFRTQGTKPEDNMLVDKAREEGWWLPDVLRGFHKIDGKLNVTVGKVIRDFEESISGRVGGRGGEVEEAR